MTQPAPNSALPQLLTVDQVAERLAISRRSAWVLIATGKLTALKLGPRITRIEVSEVEAFLDRARDRAASIRAGPRRR